MALKSFLHVPEDRKPLLVAQRRHLAKKLVLPQSSPVPVQEAFHPQDLEAGLEETEPGEPGLGRRWGWG